MKLKYKAWSTKVITNNESPQMKNHTAVENQL